ncbi:MAG: hypothetical protein HQK76_00835 [Desulfobacterales bacterium]|nr:hypothetical protein [Desulfobacterales bacterium]
MKESVKKSSVKISIFVYFMILLSTFFMPAIQGSFVPIFGVLCSFAVVPIIAGSKKIKIFGVVLLVLAVALLINDYLMGKKNEAYFRKNIERAIDTGNSNSKI